VLGRKGGGTKLAGKYGGKEGMKQKDVEGARWKDINKHFGVYVFSVCCVDQRALKEDPGSGSGVRGGRLVRSGRYLVARQNLIHLSDRRETTGKSPKKNLLRRMFQDP